jgi:ribosomal protein S27AE
MCLFGHRWGKVEELYQYCTKCGIARLVPAPEPLPSHECIWKTIKIEEITSYDEYGNDVTRYHQQCQTCGAIDYTDV